MFQAKSPGRKSSEAGSGLQSGTVFQASPALEVESSQHAAKGRGGGRSAGAGEGPPPDPNLDNRLRRAELLGHRIARVALRPAEPPPALEPLPPTIEAPPFDDRPMGYAQPSRGERVARPNLAIYETLDVPRVQRAKRKQQDDDDDPKPKRARGAGADPGLDDLGGPPARPEELLQLARERLESFSSYLGTITPKQIEDVREVNPAFGARLVESLREGQDLVPAATAAYAQLENRFQLWRRDHGGPGINPRQLAMRFNEDWLNPVRQTVGRYEGKMQAIEYLFASPPPAKKFDAFHGNAGRTDLYHTGEANDPIPFVWYKSPASYLALNTPQGEKKMSEGIELPGVGKLTAQPVMPETKLYNVGPRHEDRGDTVRRVRKALLGLGVNLAGLDIDHVVDLGFAGTDSVDNMWPLAAAINRRPVTGWRSSYGINYLDERGEPKTKAVNDLMNKHFVVKSFLEDDAGSVPAEGRQPSPEAGVKSDQEAAAKAGGGGPAPPV